MLGQGPVFIVKFFAVPKNETLNVNKMKVIHLMTEKCSQIHFTFIEYVL